MYNNNHISMNKCAGVGLKGSAHALFDGNVIARNEGYGIWLQDDVQGTFQNNSVEANKMAGMSVNHRASPNVQVRAGEDVREEFARRCVCSLG